MVDALAVEPVPTTPQECAAVAARRGVDGWRLRRVVEMDRGGPVP